jgi:UDP-N-acetylmuramoylalanine--D-glutamate ligase
MDFKERKVAVLGLGIEGLDLISFLKKEKALVYGFDLKTESELGPLLPKLKELGVHLSLGKDYLKAGLLDFSYIFRSPGVKPSLPALMAARQAKIPISSATKLFFHLCQAKIIGVTGTKGKGTTATLIYQILKESDRRVFLLGNIGEPALAALPKINEGDWVVYELSSFQLVDMDQSPEIAVVLFISSEHLDYHQSTAEYVAAKSRIVKFQTEDNFAVLNADNETSAGFASLAPAQTYYFSCFRKTQGAYIRNDQEIVLATDPKKEIVLGRVQGLKLLGRHNWENVTAAITTASLAGANLEAMKKAIFSFAGLEHRLEFIDEVNGVKFYNDSFSTTPETAIAAIRSFTEPIILIAGGSEKGSDFSQLGEELVKNSVKTLILIGQMRDRIQAAAQAAGFRGEIAKGLDTMEGAVAAAYSFSSPGDIVLLSPACASFDMFANYKDRGDQFKKCITKLKESYQG